MNKILVDLKITPGLPGEIYMSLFLIALLLILCVYIYIRSHFVNPLAKPKGIMNVAEIFVSKIDGWVVDTMGRKFHVIAPFIGCVAAYLFCSFMIGLIGFPSPIGYYPITLTLALFSFFLINGTAVYYTRWRYFKRFIEPVPIFLPMNIVSLFSPVLSLSLRLFANSLAGWVIMYMLYSALENLSTLVFTQPFFFAPIIAPFFHLYFDIFSGYIQTMIFATLTMIFTANEAPSPEEELIEKIQEEVPATTN